MRDYADHLERRLILAARAQEPRGPAPRIVRSALSSPLVWLAPPAVVAAAVGAVLVFAAGTRSTTSSPAVRASPVSFRYPTQGADSGYIIATVTDPFAAQSSLDAAFKAAGLNITVTLLPASPSLVGTVVELSQASSTGPQIEALGQGPCVTGGGSCPIGVKIPRDFTGQGAITLGRPAKPGEAYGPTTFAFAPGESLHCSRIFNEPVSAALPTIQADNITAYWGDYPANTGRDTQTPPSGSEYIVNATPVSPGVVWFQTRPNPIPAATAQTLSSQYNQGC